MTLTFSDWIGIIGLAVGLVGVVVGIIGCLNLSKANKLKTKKISNSTINQTETMIVNNGLDNYAVIKLARDTTKEELQEITETLSAATLDLQKLREIIDAMPRFSNGVEPPTEQAREGDIYFQIIN